MPLIDDFDFRDAEGALGAAGADLNAAIDGLLGPVIGSTPLDQLASTGDEEPPPFTSEPDNAGLFDPTGFVFDLLG